MPKTLGRSLFCMAKSERFSLDLIFRSRKGVTTVVIPTIFAMIFILALVVSYFRGKISTDEFFTKLQVSCGLVTAALAVYAGGTAYEDSKRSQKGE